MDSIDIEALYRRYGPLVLRRARAILGDDSSANDALQEVFLSVVRSWSGFRHEASPVTWLYRATTNHCLNQLRDESRRAEILRDRGGGQSQSAGSTQEEHATLAAILRRTPPELAEVAIYYYVDEMTQDEIGKLMEVPRRTVGHRLEAFQTAARAAAGERDEP
jgi:RNA polymerase sigma factor (sigma-70 family)